MLYRIESISRYIFVASRDVHALCGLVQRKLKDLQGVFAILFVSVRVRMYFAAKNQGTFKSA